MPAYLRETKVLSPATGKVLVQPTTTRHIDRLTCLRRLDDRVPTAVHTRGALLRPASIGVGKTVRISSNADAAGCWAGIGDWFHLDIGTAIVPVAKRTWNGNIVRGRLLLYFAGAAHGYSHKAGAVFLAMRRIGGLPLAKH